MCFTNILNSHHGGTTTMSAWGKKEPEYKELAEMVAQTPGISARELARQLGVSASTVTRRLPSLEEAGILLTEDNEGRLWPFGKHK